MCVVSRSSPSLAELSSSLQSDKLVALDDKALASGEIEPIKEGDELDFFSHKREGPHWTLGDKYPSGGIGALAHVVRSCSSDQLD